MKGMVLHKYAKVEDRPLKMEDLEPGDIKSDEILVKVIACGVCRTDLHIVEGQLGDASLPLVPGHEIVGRVEEIGKDVWNLSEGDLVGVPWLHSTCGKCEFCLSGRENLCHSKEFTGYTVNGGYAEYVKARSTFAFRLENGEDPYKAAPLLCAGIIGYRAFKLAAPPPGGSIGMFGFGSSAHITLQLASKLGFEAVAVSRSREHMDLAKRLGAAAAYSYDDLENIRGKLDSAIVFAPASRPILDALESVKSGGRVIVADIYVGNIESFSYEKYLFNERELKSVEANTREDAVEFLALSRRLKISSVVETVGLERANEALERLKKGNVNGAMVLKP